jgi:hypothetical protein
MCSRKSCYVRLVTSFACSDWAARLGYLGGVGIEPAPHHAIHAVATAGPGTRSRQRVMVPILSWIAPQWALVDSLLLEPSGELSQSDASEHTRTESCHVDGSLELLRQWKRGLILFLE